MGTLAESAAQTFGFGTAPQAAKSALGWDTASLALNTAGSVVSGIGGYQQAMYQSQVAKNNATIEKANAVAAEQSGQYAEASSKLRTGLLVGQERAAIGANNIDVNIGSPQATIATTKAIGGMDAAAIRYNAAREAYGAMTRSFSETAQSKLDQMAAGGALASGLFKAGTSFLSGTSSLGEKWAKFKFTGASDASTGMTGTNTSDGNPF